jgi:hypothetical protein
VGQILVNPKYLPAESNPEQKLKERCRACYAMREFWPQWVKDYAAKWAKAKEGA